jgi:hypothetical protein
MNFASLQDEAPPMAYNNRFDGIDRRLGDAEKELRSLGKEVSALAENINALKNQPIKENWLKRNSYWFWSVIVIVLAGGSIWTFPGFLVDKAIDEKLKQPIADIRQLQLDVKGIGTKLDTFIDLEKERLKALSKLQPEQFRRNLPEVGDAINDATRLRIPPAPDVLPSLQRNFLQVGDDAPGFWSAAAEFISYRSFNNSPWNTKTEKLRNCTDSPPKMGTFQILSPLHANINPAIYESCQLTLDSPQEDAYLNSVLNKGAPISFKHCVIVYRGGKIDLVLAVHLRNVPYAVDMPDKPDTAHGTVNIDSENTLTFVECHFMFYLNGTPPQSGQSLTRSLLANNGTTITVPVATHS